MVNDWVILALALYGVIELILTVALSLSRLRRPRPFPMSIVVLLHNQEEQVEALVRTLYNKLGQIGSMGARIDEILLVDLESTDETAAIVECLARNYPNLRTLRLPRSEGLSACDTALFVCRSPMALIIDFRQGGAAKEIMEAWSVKWNKKEIMPSR